MSIDGIYNDDNCAYGGQREKGLGKKEIEVIVDDNTVIITN